VSAVSDASQEQMQNVILDRHKLWNDAIEAKLTKIITDSTLPSPPETRQEDEDSSALRTTEFLLSSIMIAFRVKIFFVTSLVQHG
jgi:hypothetical protein